MSKEILFSKDARIKMAKGVDILYNAVRTTLGPKGRNVIIEQEFGTPLMVNDGAVIASSIELADHFENLGASILIEAANKTNDYVGDGTTTAIILTAVLIKEGLKKLDEGVNPVTLRKGLEYLLEKTLTKIDALSKPISSLDDLEKIAVISSASPEVGSLIKEAYLEVGIDGAITLEETNGLETFLDVVKGYSYDKGYMSSYMQTDKTKQIAVLDNPLILVTNRKINTMNELVPFLEEAIKTARPLFIIADDVHQEVISALVVNKLRGVFNCVVTKAPGYLEKRDNYLQDIAFLTNAKLIDEALDMELVNATKDVLGSAKKIICSKDKTTIMDGEKEGKEIIERVNILKEDLTKLTSEYDKNNLKERIGKLLGGVAIIKVAGATETELKEKKLRIEDALNATKAASIAGIIEGGGKVFYELAQTLDLELSNKMYLPALEAFREALKQPFLQIIENAGLTISEVSKQIDPKRGIWYDAENNIYTNLFTAGVIDPTSVAKSALMCAVSTASLFLTTECAITSSKKENPRDLEENIF